MIIRRTPQDFVVLEELAPGTLLENGSGTHAVYRVTKTQLTTPEAAQRLAGLLKVKANRIEYAGLKDKHAVTTQCMTVDGLESPPASVTAPAFEATLAGHMPRHLVAADIAANHFTITVREATREQCREMDRRARGLMLEDGSLGFVNYFGEQRMGSNRHGAGFVARALIAGNFEEALKLAIGTPARKDSGSRREMTRALATHWGHWKRVLRECPNCPQRAAPELLEAGGTFQQAFAALPYFEQQMFVEAYQSHLWNATAAELVRTIPQVEMVESSNIKEDGFVFPAAAHWTLPRQHLELPQLCSESELVAPWGNAARTVLEREGLRVDQLRSPGMRRPAFSDAMRPIFAAAKIANVTAPEKDDLSTSATRLKRTLQFSLPRGAYATVLLRALGQ
jgi:tRNA pseudouridine13 synthase